ncbi:hypothetical protein [Enterococcus canis]|nr:hypothetical protein [Enterococcus canis]
MYEIVPTNMQEATEKFNWFTQQGQATSLNEVIQQAILDNTQDMLNGALEGAYWKAKWLEPDRQIQVLDVIGQPIGEITPTTTTFSADFQTNAAKLLQKLHDDVQKIVDQH